MFKILIFKIKVFFIKILKGKFSVEYVELFKNNQVRSPFSPCIKDEFVSHIIMFLQKEENVKVFKTNENIQFGNTLFSAKYDEVFKREGTPSCFNALRINDYKITIIGYHNTIQGSKIKSIYYFVNDIFILGEYSFSDTSLIESINISKLIIDKYLTESTKDLDKFYIEDSNKNAIYFRDNGFDLCVTYFNNTDKNAIDIYKNLSQLLLKANIENNDVKLKLSEMF